MKIALIFPGQGSQFVGMGKDFCDKFDAARSIYRELDKILNRKLSNLIFNGNEEELSNTTNSQPSIMATSIAIYQVLITHDLLNHDLITCVAGHSLGEYSALVANKSLSFADSVKLLDIRSKAMQDSMPIGTGAMAAVIGKSEDEINDLVLSLQSHGKIYIANDNAIGQIVLSGEAKAIDFLCQNSKDLGVKRAIKLPVSAPFHCELISNASLKLKEEIENFDFHDFALPLYSNVTAKQCDNSLIKDLLVEQIISKVKWRESVENMINDGINLFIEIGPGNILTNLVKRASKDLDTISISKVEDLEKLYNIKK